MIVTRIHSLARPLPVKMSLTETSLTFLFFAAAYFSCVKVKVNALFPLLVFVRFLVLFLFPHITYFLDHLKCCHLNCTLQICPALSFW